MCRLTEHLPHRGMQIGLLFAAASPSSRLLNVDQGSVRNESGRQVHIVYEIPEVLFSETNFSDTFVVVSKGVPQERFGDGLVITQVVLVVTVINIGRLLVLRRAVVDEGIACSLCISIEGLPM